LLLIALSTISVAVIVIWALFRLMKVAVDAITHRWGL
jgi:hypothetical protein